MKEIKIIEELGEDFRTLKRKGKGNGVIFLATKHPFPKYELVNGRKRAFKDIHVTGKTAIEALTNLKEL